MKGLLLRRIVLFIALLFIGIVAESTISIVVYKNVFPTYWLFELTIYLIFLSPILIFRHEWVRTVYGCLCFAIVELTLIANLLLFHSSNDIFSVKYIVFIETATAVFSLYFINWWYLIICVLFIAVFVLFMVFVYRKIRYDKTYQARVQTIGGLAAIVMITLSFAVRQIEFTQFEKNNNIETLEGYSGEKIVTYKAENLKLSAFRDYGMYNLYFAEFSSFSYYDEEEEEEYLSKVEMAEKNDYSGTCENMNVVEIMIETGITLGVNETLTPYLYQLTQEGINMERCYSKNKTNISEYIGICGSTNSPLSSKGYENPYSLPNVLKEKGYKTTYLHNNYSTFYGRENVVKKIGFDNTVFFEGDCWGANNMFDGNYPLDSEFVNDNINTMIPEKSDQPFYTFWTTLTTHGPYNTGDVNKAYFASTEYRNTGMSYYDYIINAENTGLWYNPVNNTDSSKKAVLLEQMRDYECKLMNLDLAIEQMLNRLKETNQLDNTLIILYGDHEAYYESNFCAPLKSYIYGTRNTYDIRQYQTLMTFYNPTLSAKYKAAEGTNGYNYFVSPYVIVPTVLDLLGCDYNKTFYIGTSVFNVTSDLDNIFYSHELRILFTDKVCTYDLTSISWSDCDADYQSAFLEKADDVMYKEKILTDIYQKHYFEKKN